PGAAPSTLPGGLLALTSNGGNHIDHTTSAVPEVGFTVSYQINPNIRVHAGYTMLWWLEVVRPGDQIDFSVNPNLIPPITTAGATLPARPGFVQNASDLFVQSVNIGVEIRY